MLKHSRAGGSSELYADRADVRFGKGVVLNAFVNLYGCQIGDETRIGTLLRYRGMRRSVRGADPKPQFHL